MVGVILLCVIIILSAVCFNMYQTIQELTKELNDANSEIISLRDKIEELRQIIEITWTI